MFWKNDVEVIRDLDFSLAQLGQRKAFIGSSFFFDSVVEVITANTTLGLHLGRELSPLSFLV